MFLFEDENPAKFLETKQYIRLSDEGEPQLIRIAPVFNKLGLINMDTVAVYVDEGDVSYVSREDVDDMLTLCNCIPVEHAMNWKHKRIH